MTDGEIAALLQLLHDDDLEIQSHVKGRLIEIGLPALRQVNELMFFEPDDDRRKVLEEITEQIEFNGLANELKVWYKSEEQDLLEGWLVLSKLQISEIDRLMINRQIEAIRLDAWLEMHYELTALEKIRILNHIFFKVHQFTGNESEFFSLNNNFLPTVLESKKGNPISLACLYSIVAQRLGIPVFGVNTPQHFMLAYMGDEILNDTSPSDRNKILKTNSLTKTYFYIDPYHKGAVYARKVAQEYVEDLGFEIHESDFIPCSNVEILKRMIRNLAGSFLFQQKLDKIELLERLIRILGSDEKLNPFQRE